MTRSETYCGEKQIVESRMFLGIFKPSWKLAWISSSKCEGPWKEQNVLIMDHCLKNPFNLDSLPHDQEVAKRCGLRYGLILVNSFHFDKYIYIYIPFNGANDYGSYFSMCFCWEPRPRNLPVRNLIDFHGLFHARCLALSWVNFIRFQPHKWTWCSFPRCST